LEQFITKSIVQQEIAEKLAVSDKKLGVSIKEKFPSIECVSDSTIMELFRCIRFQLNDLLSSDGLSTAEMNTMSLGLAHSLGRYKLKFSPDKVDVMIVQAISLLDDLDKELNTYSMRVKEWYGWHFPELTRVVADVQNPNLVYAKLVRAMGSRSNAEKVDLTDILEETVIETVRKAAKVSMGTDINEEDVIHITALCTEVIEISDYREELNEYIRNRMRAIAPNLTILVGDIVGARLIAHAGSLMNLAKHPASTVQILGAEKALFRALKTKKSTPKYGLIYHASLVGQTTPKNKGKISRVLANKAALSCRVDALGEEPNKTIGMESLEKVTSRMQQLDGRKAITLTPLKIEKYTKPTREELGVFNTSADVQMMEVEREIKIEGGTEVKSEKKKKRKRESKTGTTEEGEKEKKKRKMSE